MCAAVNALAIVIHLLMLHELQVPWLSLYQGVDGPDVLALTLGVLGAFINGLIFPAFSLVFGEVRHSRVYHPFLPRGFLASVC